MLERLHIKNAALIASCEVEFGEGLHILTGETGAGKSMLIDSLSFVLGGRTGKDFIRKDAKMVSVEAAFRADGESLRLFLEEAGVEAEDDGSLLLSRTLNDAGKTVCRMNGTMVTTGMLREAAAFLVDIHGQHEHQSLLNPSKHIMLLDRFCAGELEEMQKEYTEAYESYRAAKAELETLLSQEDSIQQRMDLLSFQRNEIEQAALQPQEEEMLLERKKRLANGEKLMRLAEKSLALMYDGMQAIPSAYDMLSDAQKAMEEVAQIDESASSYAKSMGEAVTILEDTARAFRQYADGLEIDEASLEETEERLQLLYRLKRKYHADVEGILEKYEKIVKEIETLSDSSSYIAKLSEEKEKAYAKLEQIGAKMSALRGERAKQIETQIETHLKDMEMKTARFCIQIEQKASFGPNGRDKVEFLISANAGEDLKPLAKIASGGEMSRVMLALKTVLADADETETFIFDEIDSGVSGRTAQKVAEKMALISQNKQILCITHLPQIAAMADHHYLISKETDGESTVTTVTPLEEKDACQEVARLIGGSCITDTTMAAAKELLLSAQKQKQIQRNKNERQTEI